MKCQIEDKIQTVLENIDDSYKIIHIQHKNKCKILVLPFKFTYLKYQDFLQEIIFYKKQIGDSNDYLLLIFVRKAGQNYFLYKDRCLCTR